MDDFNFSIIVFKDELDDSDFPLNLARDYSFKNELVELKLNFSESEILILNPIWNVINDFNQSMIEVHEDDIIYDNEIKLLCIQTIEYKLSNFKFDSLVQRKIEQIIGLFKNAYSRNKNIYFFF